MSTLEFVSASADGMAESAAPLVTAPALVAGLGSHPALTVPLVCGRAADTGYIWSHLAETATFFGVDIPPVTALDDTLQAFLGTAAARHGQVAVAARVLVVEVGGRMQFVVSGTVIEPVRTDPVALALTSGPGVGPVPHWRQMAARTSSAADTDRAARELRAAGFADEAHLDGDIVGGLRLGSLIVRDADGRAGVGTGRLALLQAVGLLDETPPSDRPVVLGAATQARWVSPRFETHPVSAIGTYRFDSEGTAS